MGRIDASDADRLYLTTSSDERLSVERADVVYVDHPGKIGMVIGAVTSGIGLSLVAVSPLVRQGCGPDNASPSPCWNLRGLVLTMGIGYLLAGLPILVGNFAVNQRSNTAALPPRAAAPVPARLLSP